MRLYEEALMPDFSNEDVYKLNQELFAYEDQQVADLEHIIHIIDLSQQGLELPNSKQLLEESLRNIRDAESIDELNYYRHSFLLALRSVKLSNVLDTDACVDEMRETADLIIMLANNKMEQKAERKGIQDENQTDMRYLLDKASYLLKKFYEKLNKLKAEFEIAIQQNDEEIQGLRVIHMDSNHEAARDRLKELNESKINALNQLNAKYRAGLDNLALLHTDVETAHAIFEEFDVSKKGDELEDLRTQLGFAIGKIRSNKITATYNHFLKKCKSTVNRLCDTRAIYLKSEKKLSSQSNKEMLENFVDAATNILPGGKIGNIANAGVQAIWTGQDIKGQAPAKVKFGNRESMQPEKKESVGSKVWGFFKKAATVVMSVGLLALAVVECLTVVLIPKAIAMTGLAVGAMQSIADGSDFFTDRMAERKRNDEVVKKVESLEKQHQELSNAMKIKNSPSSKVRAGLASKGAEAAKVKTQRSQVKIDLLLLGMKPDKHEKLKADDIEKLKPIESSDRSSKDEGSQKTINEDSKESKVGRHAVINNQEDKEKGEDGDIKVPRV